MRVNPMGMCCTMTMPGIERGRSQMTWRIASVPPVDAPMTTTWSVAPAKAVWLLRERGRQLDFQWLTSAMAAIFTLVRSSIIIAPRPRSIWADGLGTKSTAPASSA